MIELFTDGSSRGNPGPGGYGVVLKSGSHRKEISAGYILTTNNRMELMAVIVGLEALKKNNSSVNVYSDSSYVCDAINKGWLFVWEKKNFSGKKNRDLWIRFLSVYRRHRVKFTWIKGHAGHAENERCDALAVDASKAASLLIDEGYNPETAPTLGL
jgi:ribonuclease HI